MIQNILWGAVIYIVIGALVWLRIVVDNSIERKIVLPWCKEKNRYMSFKFLKIVAFWGPRLVSNWPSPEWLCK